MSIQVISRVLSGAPVGPVKTLLLVVMADFADDDGWCYPSVATLARKVRISERTVQRAMREMQADGLLDILENAGPGGSNRYRVNTDYAALGGDRMTPPLPEGGDTGVTGGVTLVTPGGDTGDTLTVIEPSEEPSENERESAGADAQGRAALPRGAGQEAFKAAFARWPTFTSDSTPAAERAWDALAPDDRIAAAAAIDRYVAAVRADGRKLTCAFAVYLTERRWEKLPEEPAEPVRLQPFGPDWTALRFALLARGPLPTLPAPSIFIAGLIAAGGEAGERERLAHRARHGFPAVAALDAAGRDRRPVAVPDDLAEAVAALVSAVRPATRGGETDLGWRRALAERGMPAPPDTPGMDVAFWPAESPEVFLQGMVAKWAS